MTPLASSIVAFTAAATLLTVTPGLDTALVLRTAAVEGPRRALMAGLGICLGCLAWGAIVALGLGILLHASHFAYTMLKWAGAFYLVWLGVQLLLSKRDALDAPVRSGRGEIAGGSVVRAVPLKALPLEEMGRMAASPGSSLSGGPWLGGGGLRDPLRALRTRPPLPNPSPSRGGAPLP